MYKRRIVIMLVFMCLVFVALLGRLYALQIVNGQQCRQEFEESLMDVNFQSASRGTILDRRDRVLARDTVRFELCLDYGLLVGDPAWVRSQQRAIKKRMKVSDDQAKLIYKEQTDKAWWLAAQACGGQEKLDEARQKIIERVEKIAAIINEPPEAVKEAHAVAQIDGEDRYQYFRDQAEGTAGVVVRHGHKRDYPAGQYACHVIGQIAPIDRKQLQAFNLTPQQEPDRIKRGLYNYRATDNLGNSGVEKLCEAVLRPARGYEKVSGGQQKEFQPASNGRDVHLTIDMELQARLTEHFRKTYPMNNGCIVLMDIPTGEILAMVSIPTYNLQTYGTRDIGSLPADPPRNSQAWIDRPYAQLVKDDLDFPLMNRCVAGLYPPGSTFKPLAAVAAMSNGLLNAGTSVDCQGRLDPAKDEMRCTAAHQSLTLTGAIQQSCNVFFWHVGGWLYRKDPGLLVDWMARFGVLDKPGTGLGGEVAGVVRRPDSLRANMQLAIGQGELAVTPLHVCSYIAAIARDGELIRPTVIRAGEGGPPAQRIQLPVNKAHMAAICEGMHMVTSVPGGTAFKVFQKPESRLGFSVCGKSGTAQTKNKQWKDQNGDGHMQDNEVVRDGNFVWFAGFAPYENPQVAFVAMVEYVRYDRSTDPEETNEEGQPTGGGATVAGPLAVEALKACKELGYIKP